MWMTHGAQEPCLGVKVEDMKKIQKRVKMDYQLALDLYDTGIADAMYLAGLIADDAKMTKKDLQKWVENATWGMVAEYTVPWVASASPHGREIALKWMESKDEAIASAGWGTYSSMVAIKEDAVDTANGIGKVAVDLVGACKIPFAPDHIKKFEARSAIGKKRKSPKC
jgi:3-methyladenine DNA glycosylase AlkD